MKPAEIDPAIQADPDLLHFVERATAILNSEVGRVQWRDQVSAAWTSSDHDWNPRRLRLRLRDDLGEVQREFDRSVLEKPDLAGRLTSRLWGDLLQVRSHKLLESRREGPASDRYLAGSDALDEIIDSVADYSEREGHEPESLKLPIRYATALMKLGPTYWGGFYEKIWESGLRAFDGQVLLGMKVELVAGAEAELQVA